MERTAGHNLQEDMARHLYTPDNRNYIEDADIRVSPHVVKWEIAQYGLVLSEKLLCLTTGDHWLRALLEDISTAQVLAVLAGSLERL